MEHCDVNPHGCDKSAVVLAFPKTLPGGVDARVGQEFRAGQVAVAAVSSSYFAGFNCAKEEESSEGGAPHAIIFLKLIVTL